MSKEIMIFEENEVEVFEFNGKVLFNPRHVAECLDLEFKTVQNSMSEMNELQVIKLTNDSISHLTGFRKLNNTGENFLTESGVYKLIFKSRKPNAEKFQDWVTDTVLPSIRKTGSYSINLPKTYIEALEELVKSEKEKQLLQQKVEEDKPKVDFTNQILKSKDNLFVREFAKILYEKNKGRFIETKFFIQFGEKKLFNWLREQKYVMNNGSNEPYQKYIDKGIFVVEETTKDSVYGKQLFKTTKITPSGQLFLFNKIQEYLGKKQLERTKISLF